MATVEKAIPKPTPIQSVQDLLGPSRNVAEINARLAWAAEHCNLIAPATSIVHVPEFHAVSFTLARVGERDYYSPDGRQTNFTFNSRGVTIIAGEANISWHPGFTRRMDDGRNSRYAEYMATAVYLNFDATVRTVPANKSSDLTDGSDEIKRMVLDAGSPEKAESRIRNKRSFIREHVDSGAKVRAMKACQVKDSYSREEISRPFVVAKLVRTGQSDDPGLQRDFALMQAQIALKASSALFGEELDLTPHSAPPWDKQASPSAPTESAELPTETAAVDVVAEPAATVAPEPPAPAPAATSAAAPVYAAAPVAEATQPVVDDGAINPEDFQVPFGRTKGTPFTEASEQDLSFLLLYYTGTLDNPEKADYRELNEQALKAVLIVKQRRAAARAKGTQS